MKKVGGLPLMPLAGTKRLRFSEMDWCLCWRAAEDKYKVERFDGGNEFYRSVFE
jgi:hypothetical protein